MIDEPIDIVLVSFEGPPSITRQLAETIAASLEKADLGRTTVVHVLCGEEVAVKKHAMTIWARPPMVIENTITVVRDNP